jgi:hypothetical protein
MSVYLGITIFMKHIFSFLFIVLVLSACMDLDQANQDLCTPVICGDIQTNKANLTLYNDTGVDFDSFYYDIGGYQDTIGFFPLKQYSCWINQDTINTEYLLAVGVSEDDVFESDTLWMEELAQVFTAGVFVLEVYRSESSNQLNLQLIEDYQGDCKDI